MSKNTFQEICILTELFDKMVLPICTYNCEVCGASYFLKISHLLIFYQKKQCKNSLDNLYCFFFLKHILALTPEHQIGQYKVKPIEL